jgi:hypothetical protein
VRRLRRRKRRGDEAQVHRARRRGRGLAEPRVGDALGAQVLAHALGALHRERRRDRAVVGRGEQGDLRLRARRRLSATLSSTAASAGLTLALPASKLNSRGTSTLIAPSPRCAIFTGVSRNHVPSHCRSTASASAAAVRCAGVVGGGGSGRGSRRRSPRARRR